MGIFSNGYVADGMDPSCGARLSGRINAGKNAAGSKRHRSRRVMDIYFSSAIPKRMVQRIRPNVAKMLLDIETKNL
jgi:hypothetical protein